MLLQDRPDSGFEAFHGFQWISCTRCCDAVVLLSGFLGQGAGISAGVGSTRIRISLFSKTINSMRLIGSPVRTCLEDKNVPWVDWSYNRCPSSCCDISLLTFPYQQQSENELNEISCLDAKCPNGASTSQSSYWQVNSGGGRQLASYFNQTL